MWWRRLFVPARSRPMELPIRKPPLPRKPPLSLLLMVLARRGREGKSSGSGSSMSLVSPPEGRPLSSSESSSESPSSNPSQKPRGRQKGWRVPSYSLTLGTEGLRWMCCLNGSLVYRVRLLEARPKSGVMRLSE